MPTNPYKGVRLSPWIVVEEFCATRVLEGTDPNDFQNRRAFIEKTPRVLISGEWVQGPKGGGGGDPRRDETYGFAPRSRAWADQKLRELGAILND